MASMGPEKNYSFADLYEAAFGKKPAPERIVILLSLPQEEINEVVKEWAKQADWNALDVVGTDGKTYTAFYPKWGKRVF